MTETTPNTSADTGPTATWTQISRFEVTYLERENATARVYRNGRQQVPIKIVIEARNANGEVVTIPPSDLTRLTLIKYNDGGSLPSGYALQRERNSRYDYFPESLPQQAGEATAGSAEAEPALSDSDRKWRAFMQRLEDSGILQVQQPFATAEGGEIQRQEVSLWVTATDSNSLRIAAQITSPAGTIFHTRDSSGGPGKFDSSVTVVPQSPKTYTHTAFNISPPRGVVTTDYFDVDLYYISFNDNHSHLQIKDSIHYTTSADMWHYSWLKEQSNKVQVAYRVNGQRSIRFDCFCPMFDIYCNFTINDREGQATAARIIDRMGWLCHGQKSNWAKMGYIDNLGNESRLTLAATSNGNTMYLASYDVLTAPPDPE